MTKKVIFWIFTIISPFVFIVAIGEMTFRVYHYVRPFPTQDGSIIVDDQLGWRTTPNYTFHGYMNDAGGVRYEVNIHTDQHGFRSFGKINTFQKKNFFLGDSFTHAQHVSNDKTYYGILQEQRLGEIFAYGTSGYGTLQEWMILDQYIDLIHPDAIVIQYCSNDFVNNSYALELQSSWNNSGKRRPYLTEKGELIYAVPKTHFVQLRDVMMRYSQFLNSVLWRIDKFYAATHKKMTIEQVIQQMNGDVPEFHEAIRITDQILKKFRRRVAPHIPIYVFETDNVTPYHTILKKLAMENGIIFLDGIPDAIQQAQQQGILTLANDHIHWNEAGHALVARELARYLR